jgi:hypothetical protein
MAVTVALNLSHFQHLDLTPVKELLHAQAPLTYEQQIQFSLGYPREELDKREFSEIPAVRLWFVRLDAMYPWFPLLLDAKAGELGRYTAMLVPHQFHRSEGIQYNPEALEIFVMGKIFVLHDWLQSQGIPSQFRVKSFAQLLGYDLEDSFFELL